MAKKTAGKTAKTSAPAPVSPAGPEAWSWFANGALRGLGLLRERNWVFAWDDSNTIYVLSPSGDLIAQRKAPKDLVAVAGAQIGGTLVALSRFGDVWWLDDQLEPRLEVSCNVNPFALAVDPHGQYAVIASDLGKTFVIACNGKKHAEFDAKQSLKFLAFVPEEDMIIGAAEHGLLTAFSLAGETYWSVANWSNVGAMAVTGAGDSILLACFGHGIVRYTGNGEKEGSYRYDYSPSLVDIDYDGRKILASSIESQLTELTFDGQIRANRSLPTAPSHIAMDALGRSMTLGFPNGEIRVVPWSDMFGDKNANSSPRIELVSSTATENLPSWETKAAKDSQEAASAVLEMARAFPERVALVTNRKTLRIFDEDGELCHESAELRGAGRFLRGAEHWLVAATDSCLISYDPVKNQSHVCTFPLTELSHVELFPTYGSMLLVEACRRVHSLNATGAIRWEFETDDAINTVAVAPTGEVALTMDDHHLIVFGADGKRTGKYRGKPPEPITVVAVGASWMTVARDSRMLRTHDLQGKLESAKELPWAPWTTRTLGDWLVITAEDGKSLLVNASGEIVEQSPEPRDNARYFLDEKGKVCRVFRTGETIIASDFAGRQIWRHSDEQTVGPFQASSAGVVVFLGRTLTYFPFD